MKKILILFLSGLLISCAHKAHIYEQQAPIEEKPVIIEKPAQTLTVGEKLNYAVDWVGIPSGYIILEVKEIALVRGRKAYHIVAKALPNKFFRFFYDIEYNVDTYIDIQTLRPLKFHKQRKLWKKITDENIDFIYEDNKVIWEYSDPKKRVELSLPQNSQDLLSSLYYFRFQEDIKIGGKYPVSIVYGGVSWPLELYVKSSKRIRINDWGKFRAFFVIPSSKLANNITGFNKLQFYLSLDKNRLPLLFKMRTNIGYLSGVLTPSNATCKNSN